MATADQETDTQAREIPRVQEERAWVSIAFSVAGVLLAIALWWAGTRFLSRHLEGFGPVPTAEAFYNLLPTRHFRASVFESLKHLGGGLAIAIAIGVPIGVAIGSMRRLNELAYAPFQFLRMISPLSWMPVAVILLGVGSGPVYFLIAIAAIWPMIINTAHGVQRIDQSWVHVAKMLGASQLGVLRRVILPAVMPDILTGLRVSLGVAWLVLVPAEMLGVASGLGYLILDFRDVVDYSSLMAIIMVIGFLGYLSDTAIRVLLQKASWAN